MGAAGIVLAPLIRTFFCVHSTLPLSSKIRICARSVLAYVLSVTCVSQSSSPPTHFIVPSSLASSVAALSTWPSNWSRSCLSVRIPTTTANAARITNVSAAEPPASRQRIGTDLYAENVPCAADRM